MDNRMPKILLWIVWPFGGFLFGTNRFKKGGLLLPFLLFGSFIALNLFNENVTDMFRYVNKSNFYAKMSFWQIFTLRDFYYPLFAKLISTFVGEFYVYVVFYSSVYFYLHYKGINFIRNFYSTTNYLPHFAVVALFCAYPFTHYVALRYTTAVLLFVWAMIAYHFTGKRKFIWLLFLSPIVHFSFLFFLPLPFIYRFLKNQKNGLLISLALFASSFTLSSPAIATQINIVTSRFLSGSISDNVAQYASEEGIEKNIERYTKAANQGSWRRSVNRAITKYSRLLMMYVGFIMGVLVYLKYRIHLFIKSSFILISIGFALTNIATSVYHGDRFFSVSTLLLYYTLFVLFSSPLVYKRVPVQFYGKLKTWMRVLVFLVILNFVNSVYMMNKSMDLLNIFVGNWLFLI